MHILWVVGLMALTGITYGIGQGTNSNALIATIIFFPSAIALYISPGIVATARRHRNATGIWILTILLGWTALGWIIALVWAHSDNARSESIERDGTVGGASGDPSGRSATKSVADELTKLVDLKQKGILTEQEFQSQKSMLLGS